MLATPLALMSRRERFSPESSEPTNSYFGGFELRAGTAEQLLHKKAADKSNPSVSPSGFATL